MMKCFDSPSRLVLAAVCFARIAVIDVADIVAAELPLVRIAHGAFSEKVVALWLGAEQGLFRKHGVNIEVINIRSGPQTMAALVSGDILVDGDARHRASRFGTQSR